MNLGYHSSITKYLKKVMSKHGDMYQRGINRASTKYPSFLDTYSLDSTKHGQATQPSLYPRSCIIVLINFIIIFEMYVHKKLIYFVRRETERKRERACERETARKTGESSELYTCVRVC